MSSFVEAIGVKVKKFIGGTAKAQDQIGNADRGEALLNVVIEKYKKKLKEARNHEGQIS